jgi:hypothetical protein
LKICIAAMVLITFIFWISLFIGYMGDDIWSPAADERSVPAPRAY